MSVSKKPLIAALVAAVLLGCLAASVLLTRENHTPDTADKTPEEIEAPKQPVTYERAMALYSEIELSALIERTDYQNAGNYSKQHMLDIDDLVKRTSQLFDGEDDYIACTDAAKSTRKVWDDYYKFWIDWKIHQENPPKTVTGIVSLFDNSFSTGKLVNECHNVIDKKFEKVAAKKTTKFTYEGAMAIYAEIEQSASIVENDYIFDMDKISKRNSYMKDLVRSTSTFFDGEDDYMACTDAAKSAQKLWDNFYVLYFELVPEKQSSSLNLSVVRLADTNLSTGKLVNECHDLIDALKPENPQE